MRKKIMLLAVLLTLAGCSGPKEPLTPDQFKSAVEKMDMNFTDKGKTNSKGHYKAIYSATKDGYGFEYYCIKTEEKTKEVYEFARDKSKSNYEQAMKIKETDLNSTDIEVKFREGENYFESENPEEYSKAVLKEDTILYMQATKENKDAVLKIADQFGYGTEK